MDRLGYEWSLTAAADVANGPGSRYDFRNWTGDVSSPPSTDNPVTVSMDQARSITAHYRLQYQLNLATNPAAVGVSNLSGLAAGGWYDDGSTASITAAADVDITAGASRYDFRNWSGASSATTLTASVTMMRRRR